MSISPLTINIMLACYASPNPMAVMREAVWNSQAGSEIRRWLLENDLVDDAYRATDRGKAWVERGLLKTPLPVQHWSIPPRQSTVEEGWAKEAAE